MYISEPKIHNWNLVENMTQLPFTIVNLLSTYEIDLDRVNRQRKLGKS